MTLKDLSAYLEEEFNKHRILITTSGTALGRWLHRNGIAGPRFFLSVCVLSLGTAGYYLFCKKKKPAAVKPPKPPKPPKPTTSIWTEENINKLIELHRQGLTYSEIARELGVTKNSVTSKVQRMIYFGILESRMDHILWSEEDIEMLFKLREDGKTWAEIGEAFGKSSNTCQVTFSRLLERRQKCRKQSE